MTTLTWITTALLVLIIGGVGATKLVPIPRAVEEAERLGFDRILMPIGIAEALTATGILLGAAVADLKWLGAASALVIIVMMIGATYLHIRARDRFETLPSIVVGVIAVLHLIAGNAG